MKDFVSDPWISIVSLIASTSIVWTIYIPYDFPWAALAFVGLLGLMAMATARWTSMRPARSIAQLIHDIEAEPIPVQVTSERLVVPPRQSFD